MKTHDRLGRRLFTTYTKNPIKDFRPDARQMRWMQFLNVHGMASSLYLHEHTAKTHTCRQTSLRRIRDLFDGQMIYRPRQQRETEGADAHHHVYALTERGVRYLKHEGLWVDAIKPSGPWVHQFMIACVTSSVDILARRAGHRFIPGHDITNNLAVEVPFIWGKGKHSCLLIPDSLFAIQYGNGFIAYIIEADRNTEPNDPKTPHRKSARRMIKQYREFVGGKGYKENYGLNCPLVVLNVSVSNTHIDHVMNIVGEEIGACKYLAFTTAPEFRTPFKVPRRILGSVSEGKRAGIGTFDVIKKHAT